MCMQNIRGSELPEGIIKCHIEEVGLYVPCSNLDTHAKSKIYEYSTKMMSIDPSKTCFYFLFFFFLNAMMTIKSPITRSS
jgi:hypothetical protein